jgi:sugar O-acyltransferase (sialic acid O-acetyltransferase NeuD family)
MDLAKATKYLADRIVGIALLSLATPLLLLLCVLIRLESHGNPLLLQERVGARGRAFTMFRFRIRRPATEPAAAAGESSQPGGLTVMGRIVRRLRAECLPQLINVVLGEMSFVGPYPVRRGEIDSYTPRQARRLGFRPGLTGWAQIHRVGSQTQRIGLDLFYCERFSLWLDGRILWHAAWRSRPRARDKAAEPRGLASTEARSWVVTETHRAPTTAAVAAPGARPLGEPLVPIVVVGMGGHARVVLDAIEKQGAYRVVGLIADPSSHGGARAAYGYAVLGDVEALQRPETPRRAVVALGSGRARQSWFETLERCDFEIVPVVHPDAHLGRDVQVGDGAVVLAGAVVNSGVALGRGVLVRAGSTLDHGCRLEDFAHLAPGAHLAGDVIVGVRSHVGIGACVVPGIQLGSDVLVGAGAVVTQSVPRGHTVVGAPGRTMRRPDLPPEGVSRARPETHVS